MGTNYFAVADVCSCCGRQDEIHLGKMSPGWPFMFQGSDNIKDFQQWLDLVYTADYIMDEYGREVKREDLVMDAVSEKNIKNRHELSPDRDDWFDTEGNFFCSTEFS